MSAIQQDYPLPDQLPTTVTFVDQPEEGLLTTKRITDALLELADLNGCDLEVKRVPRPKQVATPVWVKEKCEEFERRLQETVDKMPPTEAQATALLNELFPYSAETKPRHYEADAALISAALTAAYEQGSKRTATDYEGVLADHQRLVKELDAIMGGSATQPSLCDVVAYAPAWRKKAYEQGRTETIQYLQDEAKALPVQHEIQSHGCCTYNWYRHVAHKLKTWAAIRAQAGQEEGA